MAGLFGYINRNRPKSDSKFCALANYNKYRGPEGWGVLAKGLEHPGVFTQYSKEPNTEDHMVKLVTSYPQVMGVFVTDSNQSQSSVVIESARTHVVCDGNVSNIEDIRKVYNLQKDLTSSHIIAKLYNLYIQSVNTIDEAIQKVCKQLEGSFAFALYDNQLHRIVLVKNYQALYIWYNEQQFIYFGSTVPKEYKFNYTSIPAYTGLIINPFTIRIENTFNITNKVASKHIPSKDPNRCVVVCSGGMDSSLSAYIAKHYLYSDVIILNMNLGQRGWESEKQSSNLIAKNLKAKYIHLDVRHLFSNFTRTPLTDYSLAVDMSDHGAVTPTEWVVMRNTILSSIAAGIAESYGASAIITGCNMEEEAAYPDNSITWINTYSTMLEHGSLYGIKLLPVCSHLMKKDIVTLGTALGVPLELTTSCYDPIPIDHIGTNLEKYKMANKLGLTHVPCGQCGCCRLRRNAFHKAKIKDPQEDLYMNPYPLDNVEYIDTTSDEWIRETLEKYKDRINLIR